MPAAHNALGGVANAAAAAADHLLQHFKEVAHHRNNLDENDPNIVDGFKYGEFTHRGRQMRGLYSKKDITGGEDVFAIPPEFSISSSDLSDARFSPLSDSLTHLHKLALWLAERRAEFRLKPDDQGTWSQADIMWKHYIEAIPTLNEYKEHGLPLAVDDAQLEKIQTLPHLADISHWAHVMKSKLGRELDLYNKNRGTRPKLEMADALWGQITAASRVYECRGMMLAPVADSLNHTGSNSNVFPMCQEDNGLIWTSSKRHINAGEELTTDFSETRDEDTAIELIQRYGMFDGGKHELWSKEDCDTLKYAGIGTEKMNKSGALLQTVGQLFQHSCPADRTQPLQKRLVMQALPGLLPPPAMAVPRRARPLRSHACRVSRAQLYDFL